MPLEFENGDEEPMEEDDDEFEDDNLETADDSE